MADEDYKRKLTAILSAGVAGYSRLMGDDEAATVSTLKSYRNLIAEKITASNGRILDLPGDNVLSEFRSIVVAVACAVEIQNGIKERNDDLPENRKMIFRIGVHLGDIIQDGDRIYGDGMTDDLITDLSKISGLKVISRNSTFAYKGKAINIKPTITSVGGTLSMSSGITQLGSNALIFL